MRVPPYAVVSSLAEAEAFAGDRGFPMVLKRRYGFAGQGVAVCADRSELDRAFTELAKADTLDFERFGDVRFLVQAYVAGSVVSRSSVAWQGSELAGTTREKLIKNPPQTGPATVVRFFHQPEVARFSAALTKGFGMTGFFGIEYIVDDSDGRAYLLEVNRRVTPGASTGELVGVDLCAALHAQMTGTRRRSHPTSLRTSNASSRAFRRSGCATPPAAHFATTRWMRPGTTPSSWRRCWP